MITFSNKNHLNKKTKKNDRRWILCFPCKDQKKTPKSKGANQDMALGVEHVYQLWKKAQETAATGCFLFWAYAGWCFSNRDVCFDLESNEIRVQWSKSLTIESPEEGRCSSYKTKSGGEGRQALRIASSWESLGSLPPLFPTHTTLRDLSFQFVLFKYLFWREVGSKERWVHG